MFCKTVKQFQEKVLKLIFVNCNKTFVSEQLSARLVWKRFDIVILWEVNLKMKFLFFLFPILAMNLFFAVKNFSSSRMQESFWLVETLKIKGISEIILCMTVCNIPGPQPPPKKGYLGKIQFKSQWTRTRFTQFILFHKKFPIFPKTQMSSSFSIPAMVLRPFVHWHLLKRLFALHNYLKSVLFVLTELGWKTSLKIRGFDDRFAPFRLCFVLIWSYYYEDMAVIILHNYLLPFWLYFYM